MPFRLVVTAALAGWLILGGWTTVRGQVKLDSRIEVLEEGSPAVEEDRYGGYVAVSLEQDGPQWIAQNPAPVPAAPVVPAPPVMIYQPPPMAAPVSPGHGCPPWRPCGPQESFGGNWLFHQTFAGADFRPACSRHDACLMSGCTSRKCCDKMFLWELKQSCHHSAFPILCRIKAREYYLGVRLFGWMY